GLLGRQGQVWLSSRDPVVGRYFGAESVVRVDVQRTSDQARQLQPATSRDEIRSLRYWHSGLPALSSRNVVLVEGRHDLLTYSSVAHKILLEEHLDPLASADAMLI